MEEIVMNQNRMKKVEEVAYLKERFEKAQSVILLDYKGLTVAEVSALRNELREKGAEYRVTKNTLIALATEGKGLDELEPHLHGSTAVIFGMEDAVSPAKIVAENAKKTKKTQIKAGVLEGKYINAETVQQLASLPTREVLIAMVLGTLNAPISGLARVINAIKEKMEEAC